MHIYITVIFTLLRCGLSLLPNEYYKLNLLNRNYNVMVLQPDFNFNKKLNTSENLTASIKLFYQRFYNDEYLETFTKNNSIDLIITDNDFVSCKKNELTAKYFNRSNIDHNHCHLLRDKKTLRNYLSQFDDINKVENYVIDNDENVRESLNKINLNNFIVKPSCGAGSGGIFNLYRQDNKLINLERFLDQRNENIYIQQVCNKYLVEEFIGGTEHNLDIVLFNGTVYFWHISDDIVDMDRFQDTGTSFPTKLGRKRRIKMLNQTMAILRHLNISHGVYHFEYKMFKKKPYLIELNPRRPGGFYVNYIEALYGSNLIYDDILIGLGKEPYMNTNAVNMVKPILKICERDVFPHVLDASAKGGVLLNNTDYRRTLNNTQGVNYTFYIDDYTIVNNTNEEDYVMYNLNIKRRRYGCNLLRFIDDPNFLPIYTLNQSLNDTYNIFKIYNNSLKTVSRLSDINNKTIDMSTVLNVSNKLYVYSDNISCDKHVMNCLYIT